MKENYTLHARIYPIAILLLPLIIIAISYSIQYSTFIQVLSTLGITAALSYFFANIGRDLGKKKETALWEKWGGPPTSQLFRYENTKIDRITKDRYHKILSLLVPSTNIKNFQKASKSDIEETYLSWTRYLITKTRDTKKYPLIFKENISYGFRRNLWGLKFISICVIFLLLIVNYFIHLQVHGVENFKLYPLKFYLTEIAFLVMLLIWVFIVTKDWIKIPAFAYAERLLEAIDSLKEK